MGKRISELMNNDRNVHISEKGIFLVRIVDDQGNYGIKKVTVH